MLPDVILSPLQHRLELVNLRDLEIIRISELMDINDNDTAIITSRFLDIIIVTIDSDMSRKWILLKIDKARVSIKARIILTSSKAAQYL